ncbi:MAG: hypothetical protein RBG13Loki_2819 [Promethearchaeota archaeon CR_4]|nr:MAG: hypothetical protein RBG13Loki_2819 [Candidatus Lokiarchaeota archaeon CR_4]
MQNLLDKLIVSLKIDKEDPKITIQLKDGTNIYLQWNDYDQYSYSIIFSDIKFDRVRFDNYDNRWGVPDRPHHYHPRFTKEGVTSPMRGKPKMDLPVFCKLILSGNSLSKEYRF